MIFTVISPTRFCVPHDATLVCYLSRTIVAALDGRSSLPFLFVMRLAWKRKKLLFPLSSHLSSIAVPVLGLPWDDQILFVSQVSLCCFLLVCKRAALGMEEFHWVTTCLPFYFCFFTVATLVSCLFSDCLLFLICCFHQWSRGEQKFVKGSAIVAFCPRMTDPEAVVAGSFA